MVNPIRLAPRSEQVLKDFSCFPTHFRPISRYFTTRWLLWKTKNEKPIKFLDPPLLLWRSNVITQKRFFCKILHQRGANFCKSLHPTIQNFAPKGRGCSTIRMACRSTIVIYWYFCTRSTALLTSPEKTQNKNMHLKCKTFAPRKCKIIIKFSAREWSRLTATAIPR